MSAADLHEQLVRLVRTLHLLRTHLASAAPGGVPWATYTLLFHLVTGGPRRAGALAECVHVDPSTASRQVDQLVRLGLAERRPDPDDGRATVVAATAAGEALHQRVRRTRERMLAELLAGWPDKDVERLTGLLSRLNDDLSDRMPELLATLGRTPDAQSPDGMPTGAPRT